MKRIYMPTITVAILLLALTPSVFAQDTESDRSLRHKSVLIFRLSTFVTWPKNVFGKKNGPVLIGVLGSKQIQKKLVEETKGASISGHPIKVVSISIDDKEQDWVKLHILFVDKSEAEKFIVLDKEKFRDAPILTFGDSDTFERDGSVIRIFLKDNKHKVSVNIDAAERKHLRINSRLLEFADIVSDT